LAVRRHSLTELADDVLRVQMESSSPTLRQIAAEVLHLLADGGEGLLAETFVSECRQLAETAESLPVALQSSLRSSGLGAPVFRAMEQVRRVGELLHAAAEQARPPRAALAEGARHLQRADLSLGPHCCTGHVGAVLRMVLEDLAHTQVELLHALSSVAAEPLRPLALSIAGRYEAELLSPDDDTQAGEPQLPWTTVLTQLRETVGELAGAQLALVDPSCYLRGDAEVLRHGMTMAWYARLRDLVDAGRACGDTTRGEVVGALRSSQPREHHARKALVRVIGPDGLAALQSAWALYPQGLYDVGIGAGREVDDAAFPLT